MSRPPPTEEHSESQESPGSQQPSEADSNGALDEGGASWAGAQEPGRRGGQRKRSDLILLGCASMLASVALGQDLAQLGRLQVRPGRRKDGENKPVRVRN